MFCGHVGAEIGRRGEMKGWRRSIAASLALVLVGFHLGAAGPEELRGTYFAFLPDLGGCYLQVKAERTISIACGNRPLDEAGVLLPDGSIIVYYLRAAAAVHVVPFRRGTAQSGGDPTSLLVAAPHSRSRYIVLMPVRWGGRVYLVPDGELQQFCEATSKGIEPRSIERGRYFLRLGDHRKAISSGLRPPACATLQ